MGEGWKRAIAASKRTGVRGSPQPRMSVVERHYHNPTVSERLIGKPCAKCLASYEVMRVEC